MMRPCAGCPPHVIHYGVCYTFLTPDGKPDLPLCECKLEEPPLPYLGSETCAERGYAADDQHEDWIVFGDSQDELTRTYESRPDWEY